MKKRNYIMGHHQILVFKGSATYCLYSVTYSISAENESLIRYRSERIRIFSGKILVARNIPLLIQTGSCLKCKF